MRKWFRPVPGRQWGRVRRAGRLQAVLGGLLAALLLSLAGLLVPGPAAAPAQAAGNGCLPGAPLRRYDIVAMSVRIVFNKWGDHDPNGMMYVLEENHRQIQELVAANPYTPVERVEPLVIRANAGECVEIRLQNELPFNVGLTPQGLSYNPATSDGAAFGQNPDSTVPPGRRQTFYWQTPSREGIHVFSDLGNPRSDETGSNLHGLFGALIVEPPGATWTHPVTGEPLQSGVFADIHIPGRPDFREYATLFHDEPEVLDRSGQPPVDPVTGQEESTMPINYRAEPARNRIRYLQENPDACPECVGEEVSLSSWPFGDPSDRLLPRAYVGDPAKFRVINAGVKETHVYHLHTHQWQQQPGDPKSTIVDSIQISPQTAYTVDVLHGAGSRPGSFGDTIWHCHLYPHFAEGMWGLWRVYDKLEDGSQAYPDGTPIPALRPLPDRTAPPAPTPAAPGFPNFVPGTFGRKAPQPPLFDVQSPRQPTAQELASSVNPNPRPGAFFTEPCPANAPRRQYDLVAIQVDLVYNDQGWHDPEGRIVVEAKDEEAIRSGRKKPEPLFIRANAGECINVNFTNKLPMYLGGNAFQPVHKTNEAGLHIHLVKFDVLNSDGTSNGWNYDESSQLQPDGGFQTIRYTWYADRELNTVFFHDHLFANLHQQHGYYAALVVEPAGSRFLDPKTGEQVGSGTEVIISNPKFPDFREFAMAVQDFAFLFDADGNPLNPPDVPGTPEDPGVMGLNYRSEPLQYRAGDDPAYALSSYAHGDPSTPVFEARAGDPVRIRLIAGAHEESHIINVSGVRWRQEPNQPQSPLVAAQSLGVSEAFNTVLDPGIKDGYSRDHLYWFGGADDMWLGLWGIIRITTGDSDDVPSLPDRRPLGVPRAKDDPPVLRARGQLPTGLRPPMAADPGQPCPVRAPRRHYNVVAMQTPIVYNSHGDHDPNGLIFALAQDEQAIRAGRNPEPLVLRASQGECIEVRLLNKLEAPLPEHDHPEVPVEAPYSQSLRVSLHPQLVSYDVQGSDGSMVGFNRDSTVGPGESRTYRWYADAELGAANIWSMTDVRNHRHHGLWGALIIEPKGSDWLNPATLRPVQTGTDVVIRRRGYPDFREFVIMAQDGIPLVDASGLTVPPPADAGHALEEPDAEDQGYKGFNYRSERFAPRLAHNPLAQAVFSSAAHGDPATPVFRAYVGDPVTVRLLMASDKPRNHAFILHGHAWLDHPDNPLSELRGSESALSVGSTANLKLIGGAGGIARNPGDYAYRSGNIRWDLEQGMWGIMRVYDRAQRDLKPLRK